MNKMDAPCIVAHPFGDSGNMPEYVSEVIETPKLGDSFDTVIDNDITDLLQDSFGFLPCDNKYETKSETKFIDDLDHSLPLLKEIFDDLQSAVKQDCKDFDIKREIDISQITCASELDTIKSVNEIQKELEYELELSRVEKLRNPKFQTMPAYEKRAKQEVQWRAAIHAASRANSLRWSGEPSQNPYSIGSNNTANPEPYRVYSEKDDEIEVVDIIKSSVVKSTKKHLSADNHFPANSRLFNTSLKQLQSQAEAISSAYLDAAAKRNRILRLKERAMNERQANLSESGPYLSTSNFLPYKDCNGNNVYSLSGDKQLGVDHSALTAESGQNGIRQEYYPLNSYTNVINKSCGESPNSWGIRERMNSVPHSSRSNSNMYSTHIEVSNKNGCFTERKKKDTINGCHSYSGSIGFYKSPHLPVHCAPTNNARLSHEIPRGRSLGNSLVFRNGLDRNNNKQSVLKSISPYANKSTDTRNLSITKRPAKKTVSLTPDYNSCYRCQKLSSVLPYLAHCRRKQCDTETDMVLLCEVCGSVVRETVVFGDYVSLDHVSSAHFPSFLVNSESKGLELESQNFINASK